MVKLKVLDAAKETDAFFHLTENEELVAESATVLTLRSEIIEGPYAGKISKVGFLGHFDIGNETGVVEAVRESVGGKVHFLLTLDEPVDLFELLLEPDTALAGPIDFVGNRFANVFGAGPADDRLEGKDGDDVLRGGRGDDSLYGGPGDDLLKGGKGANALFGGAGDDVLDGGGPKLDHLAGGKGDDVYILSDANGRDGDSIVEKPGQGFDTVKSFAQGYIIPDNVEAVVMEGEYSNTVNAWGNDLNNRITGSLGRDFINAGVGDDWIDGRDGRDMIASNEGNDTLKGGAGADYIWDFGGRNELDGGRGNDTLEAGSKGRDLLSGGEGEDLFVFSEGGARSAKSDAIADFDPEQDRIEILGGYSGAGDEPDPALVFIGKEAFSGVVGQLRWAGSALVGDADGDGRGDYRIDLLNDPDLPSGAFLV